MHSPGLRRDATQIQAQLTMMISSICLQSWRTNDLAARQSRPLVIDALGQFILMTSPSQSKLWLDGVKHAVYQLTEKEVFMITCKLCNTRLERKNLRRDGSMICPVCGQVYWKIAVDRAIESVQDQKTHRAAVENAYLVESTKSVDWIRRLRTA